MESLKMPAISNMPHLFTGVFHDRSVITQDRECKSILSDTFPVQAVFQSGDTSARQIFRFTPSSQEKGLRHGKAN